MPHRLLTAPDQGFRQLSFDEQPNSQPLVNATFVVVDLETTGGSPTDCAITEIGAVKVRGGQVLGEFATLVSPGTSIPPFITMLTGITDAMVAPAPEIGSVLPAFLEFAAGCVLVAHNARFDVGFLRAASADLELEWPVFPVVDTVTLARRVLARGETPNCKLATLAALFRAETTPSHRALDDARATVDVLHGLIGRLGNVGVHSLEELQAYSRSVSQAQRNKRHLAHGLPSVPGVYIFRAADSRPLYVGTSRDIHARVRSYFVASQTRSRIGEMVAAAQHVEAVTCAHALEAQVRELRLIAAHNPPYNRRSRYPDRTWWIAVTSEAYPRLSLVRTSPADRDRALGPFRSRRAAQAAADAAYEALPIRRCTARLSLRRTTSACVLAEMSRCGAPCEHRESVPAYQEHVDKLLAAFVGDPADIVERILARIHSLASASRYEDAATLRDRLG
ncbi:MAG: DEDD exonuclease domain-containing protein, partial [Mycobacteriales bacterium]